MSDKERRVKVPGTDLQAWIGLAVWCRAHGDVEGSKQAFDTIYRGIDGPSDEQILTEIDAVLNGGYMSTQEKRRALRSKLALLWNTSEERVDNDELEEILTFGLQPGGLNYVHDEVDRTGAFNQAPQTAVGQGKLHVPRSKRWKIEELSDHE